MSDHAANIEKSQLTATGIPVRNLWHMLLYALDAVHLQNSWKSQFQDAPDTKNLLASFLVNLIERRLRIGLSCDYRGRADVIAGVKGRIDFNRSLKQLNFLQGRAACEFQVFSENVPKNQIIRSTLTELLRDCESSTTQDLLPDTRTGARQCILRMRTISPIEVSGRAIRRELAKRHDADYRLMLSLCQMLHECSMPSEFDGENKLKSLDRDAYIFHRIYEKFVANFYGSRLLGWKTTAQKQMSWPAEGDDTYLPKMRPDLVVQHRETNTIVVLDTKFTARYLKSGPWDTAKFDSGHLYQMYAYIKSQEQQSPAHAVATGILLYPTVEKSLSETVNMHGNRFRWETIDLALPWQQIESRLLEIFDEEPTPHLQTPPCSTN